MTTELTGDQQKLNDIFDLADGLPAVRSSA
jgi:hypothetical protein